MICCIKRKSSSAKTDDRNVEAFLRSCGSLAPKRYSYSDIKKMTNSLACKLGQGGFGSVYKGEISDGHLVAVKLLSELKSNGEEFINEVASISRTCLVNIVTLLGFCYEGPKRALVYEFMPNGSLDKFISHQESPNRANLNLEWKTIFQIAVGIARGLEYLHSGCTTRILHLDIKPHNILLDEDFCPKISDFGLAKLCQRKESIISMTGARGTVGYIPPEVFCRNFGGVSHKSDVYSYGMLVLEMVGGRKNNIDIQESNASEVYFPDWIYENLEQGKCQLLLQVTTDEEQEIARKMIIVSMWCIQTNPSNRPSLTSLRKEPNRMLPSEVNKINFPQTVSPRISMSCLFFNRPFYSQLRTSPFSLQILTSERPLAMSSSRNVGREPSVLGNSTKAFPVFSYDVRPRFFHIISVIIKGKNKVCLMGTKM